MGGGRDGWRLRPCQASGAWLPDQARSRRLGSVRAGSPTSMQFVLAAPNQTWTQMHLYARAEEHAQIHEALIQRSWSMGVRCTRGQSTRVSCTSGSALAYEGRWSSSRCTTCADKGHTCQHYSLRACTEQVVRAINCEATQAFSRQVTSMNPLRLAIIKAVTPLSFIPRSTDTFLLRSSSSTTNARPPPHAMIRAVIPN